MSITREEAIKHLRNDWFMSLGGQLCVDEDKKDAFLEAVGMGIKALRPVSRKQVERMRGEWMFKPFYKGTSRGAIECQKCKSAFEGSVGFNFCPHCGSPMTDEAVEIVMKRLEALHDTGN